VLHRQALVVARLEDLAARQEVLLARLEEILGVLEVGQTAIAEALRSREETEPEAPGSD